MQYLYRARGGSKTAATSKMELFVIIVNGFQPLTTITKSSILDVAAVLDLPLTSSKAHSEPSQTSKMELFAKIANDQKPLLFSHHKAPS